MPRRALEIARLDERAGNPHAQVAQPRRPELELGSRPRDAVPRVPGQLVVGHDAAAPVGMAQSLQADGEHAQLPGDERRAGERVAVEGGAEVGEELGFLRGQAVAVEQRERGEAGVQEGEDAVVVGAGDGGC